MGGTLRSVIGGLAPASALLLAADWPTGGTPWFLSIATLMAAAAAGRSENQPSDGSGKAVFPPLLAEPAIIAILVSLHLRAAAGGDRLPPEQRPERSPQPLSG